MPLRKNNKSITFLAKNSKIINFIGLLLIVLGAVISYFNWNVEPEELEQQWLKFEAQIPNDLVLYGHDYIAVDMNSRVRNGVRLTHQRYA